MAQNTGLRKAKSDLKYSKEKVKFSIKSFLTDEINYFLYIWESSITDYLEIILNNARKIPPSPDEQIDEKLQN